MWSFLWGVRGGRKWVSEWVSGWVGGWVGEWVSERERDMWEKERCERERGSKVKTWKREAVRDARESGERQRERQRKRREKKGKERERGDRARETERWREKQREREMEEKEQEKGRERESEWERESLTACFLGGHLLNDSYCGTPSGVAVRDRLEGSFIALKHETEADLSISFGKVPTGTATPEEIPPASPSAIPNTNKWKSKNAIFSRFCYIFGVFTHTFQWELGKTRQDQSSKVPHLSPVTKNDEWHVSSAPATQNETGWNRSLSPMFLTVLTLEARTPVEIAKARQDQSSKVLRLSRQWQRACLKSCACHQQWDTLEQDIAKVVHPSRKTHMWGSSWHTWSAIYKAMAAKNVSRSHVLSRYRRSHAPPPPNPKVKREPSLRISEKVYRIYLPLGATLQTRKQEESIRGLSGCRCGSSPFKPEHPHTFETDVPHRHFSNSIWVGGLFVQPGST